MCDVRDSFLCEVKKHCNNVILYSSLEEMLKDTSLDLISICSKKRSEQEKHAIMCLKAGKHVLYGKDMPMSHEEELHPLRVVIRAFNSAKTV